VRERGEDEGEVRVGGCPGQRASREQQPGHPSSPSSSHGEKADGEYDEILLR